MGLEIANDENAAIEEQQLRQQQPLVGPQCMCKSLQDW